MKQEIRKLLGTDKLIIGTDRVLKSLRKGELSRVLVASNCAPQILEDLERYAKNIELTQLDVPNEELGVYCKKPFHIMVLGIRT